MRAMTMRKNAPDAYKGIPLIPYQAKRGTTDQAHPWIKDIETKVIRGEAAFHQALALQAQGYQPDLVIAHHGWGESLFIKDVWPKAKLALYCEFNYQEHGADIGFDPEFLENEIGQTCRLRLKNLNNLLHFQMADAAISPTQWQAQTFPLDFQQKIRVIHDGVDTDAIVPNPKATLTLDDGTTFSRQDEILTFVNRNLEPYRGYHIFMRALPALLKKRPNLHVLIVGGDSTSYGKKPAAGQSWKNIFIDEVRPQMSAEEWARIHFLGLIPYNRFIPLLQISTVHVYLSYPFVLSWSLLEAMSTACAIVASDTASVKEVIHHQINGQLVNFFDTTGLVQTITQLLEHPDQRAQQGEAARSFVRQNYDLKRVCLPQQLEWVGDLLKLSS